MSDLDIEVLSDLDHAAALWAAFARGAHASPYQSFDWESAWWRHVAEPGGESLKLVSLRRNDALLALLPLTSRREAGVRVVRFLGGTHFNLQLPLWRDGLAAALSGTPLERLLRRIGEVVQADVVELSHQPRSWQGEPNPFVPANAEECVSPTFVLALDADFATVSRAQRSAKSLQQIRRKRKLLQNAFGDVKFRCAQDPASRERAIDAVIRQRNTRRDSSGIPSFFDTRGGEAFIRNVAAKLSNDEGDGPLLRIDCLEVGGEIAATYLGVVRSGVYSCFLNSFDAKFENFSPGEIILHDLVEALCADDMTMLDLGVGVEQYKKSWCNPLPLFEVAVALNARGAIYTNIKRLRQNGKRIIKRNETLWRAWRSLRRMTTRGLVASRPAMSENMSNAQHADEQQDHPEVRAAETGLAERGQAPDTPPASAPGQTLSCKARGRVRAETTIE